MAKAVALLDELIQKYENRLGKSNDSVPEVNIEKPSFQESKSQVTVEVPKSQVPVEVLKASEKENEEEKKSVPEKAAQSHEEHKAEPVDLSKAPYELFSQIDIRVGDMQECWKHPTSDNLYCEKIDVGEGFLREIGSGLQKSVPISDMTGKVLVMANLRPRKLGGFNSNGMVMALHSAEGLELVRPGNAEVGERVGLEGLVEPGKGPILAQLNPKKKILEKAIDYFATDSEGYACFGEKKLVTSAGFILTRHAHGKIS